MKYWWHMLGELGRVHAISQSLDWQNCRRPHYVKSAQEGSGVFQIGGGRVQWRS